MSKTKDRWERLVEKVIRDSIVDVEMLSKEEVVKLLRQEHRAVVRMVKKELLPVGKSERCEGWNQAVEAILELLARRAA